MTSPATVAFLNRMRGTGAAVPPRAPWRTIGFAALGGAIAIAVVAALTQGVDELLILGSFGATCVLVFGFPDVPFSQPRNIVGGHVLSSFMGLLAVEVLGIHWWTAAIAVAAAIAGMMVTRTVHPPAGSNPVIVYLLNPDWNFLWFPTLIGATLVVAVALVFNNATRPQPYPTYW